MEITERTEVGAMPITQLREDGLLVTTWMPTLGGYPIGSKGKPIFLATPQGAVGYAEGIKAKRLQTAVPTSKSGAMKTVTRKLSSIKDTNWASVAFDLLYEDFSAQHPDLDADDELPDLFYDEEITRIFEYGDYADIEIVINKKLEIVGGRIIPCRSANDNGR